MSIVNLLNTYTKTMETNEETPVIDTSLIEEATPENIKVFLEELIQLKDKKSIYQYIIVNPAAHKAIQQTLLTNNTYKVRIEEIAWLHYTVTSQFRDNDTPQVYLSPIDVARAISVYTDYEGNAVMIEDLFTVYKKEWTKTTSTPTTSS